jgi:hypothetical protein
MVSLPNRGWRGRDTFIPVPPTLCRHRVHMIICFTFLEGNEDARGQQRLTSSPDVSSQLQDQVALPLVPTAEEAGCAAEPVWTLWRKKSLAPAGNWTPAIQTHCLSLYQHCYQHEKYYMPASSITFPLFTLLQTPIFSVHHLYPQLWVRFQHILSNAPWDNVHNSYQFFSNDQRSGPCC